MTTRNKLLKEIDAMVASADRKRMTTEGISYTLAAGELSKGVASACIIILKGKRKLKAKKINSRYPEEHSFSHYIKSKYYVGILMKEHFENMFFIKIKPGRYRYMTGTFQFSKNKKPKMKK